MHSSQITKPFILFVLLFSSFLGISQTPAFLNGDFESSVFQVSVTPIHWTTVYGSPDTGNILENRNGNYNFTNNVSSLQGGNFLMLYDSQPSGLPEGLEIVEQTLSGFNIGVTYTITYEEANLGARSSSYDENSRSYIKISDVGTFQSGNTLNVASGWQNAKITFVATNTSHTIRIYPKVITTGSAWVSFDDFKINSHDFSLSKNSSIVDETGLTDNFNVVLNAPPTSDVVLNISSSDTSEVTVSSNILTFTSLNWDIPQSVTITGVDDFDSDGNQIAVITVSVNDLNSEDSFDASSDKTISVTNRDDDLTVTLTDTDVDNIVKAGDIVTITATFSEDMSSSPEISIGGLVSDVVMTSSSSTTWSYAWTVPSGTDGTVSATVSGTDIAGNAYSGTDSITFTIDNLNPIISIITSPNTNGKYTDDDANPANSDTISITLTFSEAVIVANGATPTLTLNTLPSQNAIYTGGSGTQTLTFSYKVLDGDEVADLSVLSVSLRGATIKDVAGNNADLSFAALNTGNLAYEKNIQIRAKDPTFINLTAISDNTATATQFGATDSNTVTYTFTSDIPLLSSSVSMTFGGFSTQPSLTQSNAGNTYSLSFTVLNSMPEGALNLTLFATDTHSSTLVPEENRSADYTQTAFNQTLIIDRTAPIITPTAFSSPENSITGPRILANEVVFNYSLTGGADQAKFTINPTTGVLSFVNAPDFEAPTDAGTDNVYDIEVGVTDIVGLTATQTIAVTVTDVSDTFGVDLTALDTQTSEAGDTASVNVKLFTEPTATVRLALQSSDTSEGSLSTSSLEFTTSNWNVDQNVQITGVDDSEIDGDISYLFQVASVVSEDVNYNALVVGGLGLTNIDNEIDTDGDGFFDYQDAFPTDPLEWADTDGDGIGNNADLDDDGDGFSDLIEIECGSNSLDNSEVPLDSDADGTIDCQDTDDDNDGIPDSQDNCPFVANASQADADLDGIGDACDPDDDNDGTLDAQDAFPLDPTESIDTDGDGIGNNADLDDDNDGQSDIHENNCFSDPLSSDTMALDSDSDNIPDCIDTDDDNDGVEDTEDVFPLDPAEWSDTDQDGIGNNADTDDDNDGFSDVDELSCDSDPFDASSRPSDIDNDGIADCIDTDMDGDGVLNSEDLFPTDPSEWSDNDQDGLGDNFDVDDDNDGYLDSNDDFPLDPNEWVDQDQDGLGDNEDRDDNADGFDDEVILASGVLTPNTNGLESTWKVINIEQYPNARVRVYSPNAIEVFSAVNYKNDWRGTFKGSNKLLPAGSYYYIVDLNDGERPMTGWLYISY